MEQKPRSRDPGLRMDADGLVLGFLKGYIRLVLDVEQHPEWPVCWEASQSLSPSPLLSLPLWRLCSSRHGAMWIQKEDPEPRGSLIFHHPPPYLPLPLSFLVPDETLPVHAPDQSSRFISPQPITSASLIVCEVAPSFWSPVCLCSC